MSDLKQAIQDRKKREEQERVRAIMDAAKEVFYSKGYLKATMDDVALASGMSKPLIYKHFKSKDDLYFSLTMIVFDESLRHLNRIERKIKAGKYRSGAAIIHDLFQYFEKTYQFDPEAFKIVLLFQHTGMVWELNDDVRSVLFRKGRKNYIIARRLSNLAMEQGLFKKMDPYQLVDTVWAGFLGIVRLEDTKSGGETNLERLKANLSFFENMVSEFVAT
jgi:TetR/AcrR family transcriptional regulator